MGRKTLQLTCMPRLPMRVDGSNYVRLENFSKIWLRNGKQIAMGNSHAHEIGQFGAGKATS
jgi:hypothetical protein